MCVWGGCLWPHHSVMHPTLQVQAQKRRVAHGQVAGATEGGQVAGAAVEGQLAAVAAEGQSLVGRVDGRFTFTWLLLKDAARGGPGGTDDSHGPRNPSPSAWHPLPLPLQEGTQLPATQVAPDVVPATQEDGASGPSRPTQASPGGRGGALGAR